MNGETKRGGIENGTAKAKKKQKLVLFTWQSHSFNDFHEMKKKTGEKAILSNKII